VTKEIKLGQEVKDTVTGFTGIAVSVTEFLQGCRRVEVQPKVDEAGKLQELGTFDEPQLEVVGHGVLEKEKEEKPKRSGGPHSGNNPRQHNRYTEKD